MLTINLKEYVVTYKNMAGEQHRRVLWAKNIQEALSAFFESQYYSQGVEILSIVLA